MSKVNGMAVLLRTPDTSFMGKNNILGAAGSGYAQDYCF
jgi:hypothetical protein